MSEMDLLRVCVCVCGCDGSTTCVRRDSLGRTLVYLFFLSTPGGTSSLVTEGVGNFWKGKADSELYSDTVTQ